VDKHTDILYRLARFLAGIPPEALGVMVLLALQHHGLVVAIFAMLFAIQVMVLKFVGVAIVSMSKFVAGAIAGSVVTWYLQKMFMLHVWPRLPQDLRRFLLKLKKRVLLTPPDQHEADTRDDDRDDFSGS
jgi:hypothetical protein